MALLISYEVQVNCVVPGLVETRWTATVSEEFSPAGKPITACLRAASASWCSNRAG